MGGLTILPELSITDLNVSDVDILILPGGCGWEKNEFNFILPLLRAVNKEKNIIAAICGATIILAQNGFLDKKKHTSNAIDYLKQFAFDYKGESQYIQENSVSDENIITANGVSPVEFARDIFTRVGIMNSETCERWFNLFKYGVWSE